MPRKKVSTAENTVRNIRRRTRKKYSGEEKIRIVLEGLRGKESVAELCRREGISESVYYRWSKEFLRLLHHSIESGGRDWSYFRGRHSSRASISSVAAWNVYKEVNNDYQR